MKEKSDKNEDGDYGQEYDDDSGCDGRLVEGIPEPKNGVENGYGLQYKSCLMNNTMIHTRNDTMLLDITMTRYFECLYHYWSLTWVTVDDHTWWIYRSSTMGIGLPQTVESSTRSFTSSHGILSAGVSPAFAVKILPFWFTL